MLAVNFNHYQNQGYCNVSEQNCSNGLTEEAEG